MTEQVITWQECGRCRRSGLTTVLEFTSGSTWRPFGAEPKPQKRAEVASYHCPYHQCEISNPPTGTWICPHCAFDFYSDKQGTPTCMDKVEQPGIKASPCHTKMIPLINVIEMRKVIERIPASPN